MRVPARVALTTAIVVVFLLAVTPQALAVGVSEGFETGYTLADMIGAHAGWYDGGEGPVVNTALGVTGSVGLAPAMNVFTWTAHPFSWNAADFQKLIVQMDFQADGSAEFDDERIGWMISDASVNSDDFFGTQVDTDDGGIVTYWRDAGGERVQTPIVALSGIQANAWYRFRVEITKLSGTAARLDVSLVRLDASGNPTGTPITGVVADTASWAGGAPATGYFAATTAWPAFKNYDALAGNSDNAYMEVVTGPPNYGIDFGGTNAYVNFGDAAALHLSAFTIETWFRRDGSGVTTTTGTGGVTAVPLVAKGRGEADGNNRDANYFLGIRGSDNVLAADFEEGAAGASPGLNHPVAGITPIVNGVWYHAAVTYDGNKWQLFLNGGLERELVVGQPVRSDSIQYAALASALTSTGAAAGFFNGVLDETRIWNYARSQTEIRATINAQITAPQTGLVARWGLDEGTGTAVNGSAGTAVNGTITGANYTWVTGAPFNAVTAPPAAPTGLTATPTIGTQIDLAWTDNSDNEATFEIERSTTGAGGPFNPLGTVGANITTWTDTGLAAGTPYCYRLRASNVVGPSAYTDAACATTAAVPNNAIKFGGTNAYVTFGNNPALGLAQFTIETWFRRDAAGTAADTGTSGIDAIPLITKGLHEADGSNVDANYFLGIRESDSVLAADFEEGASGTTPGLNHPVAGVTPIVNGVWYHAAATYDGSSWKLYLNGHLERELTVGQPCRSDSIQHAGLATAMNSSGSSEGRLDGILDEVRIWNYARSQSEIRATINAQVDSPQAGLVARWGLNEGLGTTVSSTAGTAINGTLTGSNYRWAAGAPFSLVINDPPDPPEVVAPLDGATGIGMSPQLRVNVADPEAQPLTVTFYGRPATAGSDFTIAVLPDTQFYAASMNGGTPSMFYAQTQWIADHKVSDNIAFVAHVGDISQNGDDNESQWIVADAAFDILDAAGLIPYGLGVGNHDQKPQGDVDGTTIFYNQYFGTSRYTGRSYYGGHFWTDNDNSYQLFSAGGMNFIVICLEYDAYLDPNCLTWASNLLATHSTRKGIVVSHGIIEGGNPAAWRTQGLAIYDAFKGNPNLFLMLCGHISDEGQRTDTYNGNTVHTLMADYQNRSHGGDGWMRLLRFSPGSNEIHVQTYSPTLGQWETDTNSDFILPYNMGGTPLATIGTNTNVPSGTTTSMMWPGLTTNTQYEWRVSVSDGVNTVMGPTCWFTTGTGQHTLTTSVVGSGSVTRNPDQAQYSDGQTVRLTATPAAGWRFHHWSGSLSGSTNPQDLLMDSSKAVTAHFLKLGDFDENGAVEQADFIIFRACATGATVPYVPGSLPLGCDVTADLSGIIPPDFNEDGDVDMDDFGEFQAYYGG